MSEPITPADARAEINRVLGDAAHPYWDRQHPEHRAAMERMQVLFAVKVGRFGPPIEYTTAREQDRAEGYRAGIEAAAQWHDEMAFEWDGYGGSESREYAKNHRADARSIRALADKAPAVVRDVVSSAQLDPCPRCFGAGRLGAVACNYCGATGVNPTRKGG